MCLCGVVYPTAKTAEATAARCVVGRRRPSHAAATGAGLEPKPKLSGGADHQHQHVVADVLHQHAQPEGHDLQGA